MTSRQRKFLCWLSSGRRVSAYANVCSTNPKLLFGEIDTDPRSLKQPELDEFLSWWCDLEARHFLEGFQIQFRISGLLEEFSAFKPVSHQVS